MPRMRTMRMAGILLGSGVFLTVVACAGLLVPQPTAIPTLVPPSATAIVTETAVPLYQQVKLASSALQEQGQPSIYTITAQVPKLVGSSDPRVQRFNDEMTAVVDKAIADFKQNVANLTPIPDSTISTFDLRWNLLSAPGNILSLKFDIQTYYSGAAHPGDVSQTANFDLQQGNDLTLADLFLPGVDYLTPIAKYSIDQLSNRDISFQGFELGATATLQNYRNWNVTPEGLMITFDEYQVAPYAAGPQTVIIPYRQLAQLIEPNGALQGYAH